MQNIWKAPSIICTLLQVLGLTITGPANTQNHSHPYCKAIPGTSNWPSFLEWSSLNTSLSGRLITPIPPGAVCHPSQPSYDASVCPSVQADWLTSIWHTEDPVGTICNNFNNDTCLPSPNVSCSGAGYPVYVINATCAEDVKLGVNFARRHDVRLIVKGTGHDYLGRSVAPNSLSIWTHHIKGLSFQDGFQPEGCKFTLDGPAVTAAAGTQMLEIDYEAHLRNLTIVGGGAGTVGVGGYLLGGGHSALSSTYGMAADQVLEMVMVTPGGEILTISECQNTDLFWAMRGGGGSTFGVLTSVTFKAYPSIPFIVATGFIFTLPGTDTFWDVVANILSQFPALDDQGIMAYSFIVRKSSVLGTATPVDAFVAGFLLPVLHSENTTASLTITLNKMFARAIAGKLLPFYYNVIPQTFDDFWAWYNISNGPLNAGFDQYIGSRLLDGKALTQNLTALAKAFKDATPENGASMAYLVGGKGVMNAKPRGGSNAVGSAWRTAYVHAVMSVQWQPFNDTQKAQEAAFLNDVYVEALRKLAPNTGAYVNEAYPYEPDFQEAFWGTNYPRLLEIKRKFDPDDIFWCHPCVGNEKWEVVGDMLCRV